MLEDTILSRKPPILLLMSAECSIIFTATMAPFQRPAQGFSLTVSCASQCLASVWDWELRDEVDLLCQHLMGKEMLQGKDECMTHEGQLL